MADHDALVRSVATRLSRAKALRTGIEDRLDDCYRYALPGRQRFRARRPGGAEDDIYDETAVVALEDFASVMHARLTPDAVEWMMPRAGAAVPPEDRAAINADLEDVNAAVFQAIHASNFGSEAHECYLDMGCSTGTMFTRWDAGRLVNSSAPMTHLWLDSGAEDEIGAVYRVRDKVRMDTLEAMYPDGRPPAELEAVLAREPDATCEVTDALWTDYRQKAERRAVIVSPGGRASRQWVLLDQTEKGYGAKAYVAPRMSKAAGEVWGRGPVMRAMAGIKTTNLVIELLLQNAALAMVGMWTYEDDGVVNVDTIRIEPGTVVPHAPGSLGLRRMDMRGGDVNMAQLILDDQRRNIRRALYGDALADPGRTPATALEVSYRTQDLAERISASFNRLRHELLAPYWRRVAWLMERAGRIRLPVPIDRIDLVPNGPLARVMGRQHVQNILELHQIFAAILGPQLAVTRWSLPELEQALREHLGVPSNLIATPAQQQETMQQAAAATQALGLIQQGPVP